MGELEDRVNSILSDPAQMEKLAAVAKKLMGGGMADGGKGKKPEENPGASTAGGFSGSGDEAEALKRISRIISEANSGRDDKTALLKAMEPYLSEKRREKMSRAVKIARIARIARIAAGETEKGNV